MAAVLVAWFYGGMGPAIFIARLHDAVSVTHFGLALSMRHLWRWSSASLLQ